MEENQQESTQSPKGGLNPLLIVVIIIIVGAVGVMLWIGSNKSATKAAMTQATQPSPTQAMMMKQDEKPTGTATQSATGNNVTQQAIAVEGGNYYFKPNVIKVKKGEPVKITITNKGGFHDFAIDAFNVKSAMIPSGGSTVVTFTPDKTGSFEFYCSVANHRAMGMKGTLIVE